MEEKPEEKPRPSIVDLNALRNEISDSPIYSYWGSLTTPPCKENVSWSVVKRPILISPAQYLAFHHHVDNARPVQHNIHVDFQTTFQTRQY